jgi:hypothetical protein
VYPFDKLPLSDPTLVTVTVTPPTLPAGVLAVMVVLFTIATLVAIALPNVTVAPGAKFVPVMVTAVPPDVDPLSGLTSVTVGGTTYVNALARLPLSPLLLVTVTVTAPALPAGVVAVISFPLTTTTLDAAVPPNVTVAPATKLAPVMVTAVPPVAGPLFGLTLLTVG